MPDRLSPARRRAAAVLVAAALAAALAGPPAAARDFIPRPTTPYRCDGLAGTAGPLWVGRFSGQKETNWDFRPYETVRVTVCFTSEADCRNWLYNMLSEYRFMVWTNDCRRSR